MRTSKRLTVLLALVVVIATGLCGQARAEEKKRAPMKVTFLGNSGFLIETGSHKVIVDGLFRAGVEGLYSMPREERDTLEAARPPFDNVDLVLVTHNHPDHVDPIALGNYLSSNSKAMMLTTPGVVERLQLAYRGYDDIYPQVGGFKPPAQPLTSQSGDFSITAFSLDHINISGFENMGFAIAVDGWKFFHGGDGVATMYEFRTLGFHTGSLDVAFMPYWYIADDILIQAMRQGLAERYIIITHMPPRDDPLNVLESFGGWDSVVEQFRAVKPNAIVFEHQFDSRVLD